MFWGEQPRGCQEWGCVGGTRAVCVVRWMSLSRAPSGQIIFLVKTLPHSEGAKPVWAGRGFSLLF